MGSAMSRRLGPALAVLCLLQAPAGLAQTAGEGIEAGDSPDQITLNFQDVDIRALINTVSEVTGRNFIVDPRVSGQVTLVSGGPLDADRIYDVFLSVLSVHNFAAVPAGDVVKIVPTNIVKQEPTPTASGAIEPDGSEQITQVYKLKHASVQEMVPILRPMLPPTSHFAAHTSSNTLVFTDTRGNVRRILDIIERMDVPDRSANVRVVYLDNARASEIVSVISQLASNLNQAGGEQRRTQVSVQADPGTNALVINAPDQEYQMLQAVVDQLDIERPSEKDIHVINLQYAKATDLVELLNQVSQGLIDDQADGGAGGRNITVQAEEGSNALVVHARPKDFESIKAVVNELDVKRKQVFVEAIVAEVSFNKSADLGIEWRTSGDELTPGGEISANTDFAEINGGLTLGFVNQFIVNATGEVVPDLEIILRALRSDSHTNILSTPNLLTLDNEEAEIIVGQEVPFLTGQFTTPVTGGDGNQDVNPFQTIERRDVGLSLKITPQINAGETITMEVEQEISNVSETTVQGATDLITDERRINATVQVDSGQIVVIGGLIRDDVLDTVQWVPVLGRIPIIGELFKRKEKSVVKTNLMVFLRPKIIENAAMLAQSTRKKYDYMRELAEDSQPGTKNLIRRREPPQLPEIQDWENPDDALEPEVIPDGPGMFP